MEPTVIAHDAPSNEEPIANQWQLVEVSQDESYSQSVVDPRALRCEPSSLYRRCAALLRGRSTARMDLDLDELFSFDDTGNTAADMPVRTKTACGERQYAARQQKERRVLSEPPRDTDQEDDGQTGEVFIEPANDLLSEDSASERDGDDGNE
jgi:hypothetical protein